MFNRELKERFISECVKCDSTKQRWRYLFKKTQVFEEKWCADLCTRNTNDLQFMVDQLSSVSANGRHQTIVTLKRYVHWCINNGVENACDGVDGVVDNGIVSDSVKMVANPAELQLALDSIFVSEDEDTVDNLFRAFYWLSFSGMLIDKAINVGNADINMDESEINYCGRTYTIYYEARKCIKKCMELPTFRVYRPRSEYTITRGNGKSIFRNQYGDVSKSDMINYISRKKKKSNSKYDLSYNSVWLSGLFYRTYYGKERRGIIVDFASELDDIAEIKNIEHTTVSAKNSLVKFYTSDYENWKKYFGLS